MGSYFFAADKKGENSREEELFEVTYFCSTLCNTVRFRYCGEMGIGLHDEQYESAPPCHDYDQKILYAWASDAPELKLPKGVGFKVGGRSSIKYLVVQVHYIHAMSSNTQTQ